MEQRWVEKSKKHFVAHIDQPITEGIMAKSKKTPKQSGGDKIIAKHIDCVIGMSKAIDDEAAINFAVAFYQALGYGKDVKTAFDLGCVQIDLQSLNEQDTPQLLATKCDPEEIAFV